ncbi:Nucleoporin nup84 [Microbotryomycetes sp. JL221]|nr:Nucleoporin nup84 [Microbotryomycetes sp. JL221]
MDNEVYSLFSEQLQLAQTGELDVINDEDGLLSRWSAICQQKLQDLSVDLNGDLVEAWTLESNTWQLVQALYTERLQADPQPSTSKSNNPYTPPIVVAQQLIESSRELTELAAIREWLHSIPTSLNPAEIRRGYLPYTKNKLKQAKRTRTQPQRGLVTELDPDATLRSKDNQRLDSDDESYERALLRSLFEYVRAGELDLAIDMCRQSDQSWRAASLSGGRLWSDPNLIVEQERDILDVIDQENDARTIKGTLNRRLWKQMCRKLASTTGVDPFERALYGAISGDLDSVLPVCTTWEDIVWAHVNSLFEANVETGLWKSSQGRYWSRRSVAPLETDVFNRDVDDPLFGRIGAQTSVKSELESIFDRLLKTDKGDLGMSAKNPFHVSQTYLIVNRVSDLFTTFVERLEHAANETEPDTLAHLLRFFAHLVLVMRLMNQPLPDYATNRILEAYVQVLEASEQDESLIAFYASNLDQTSAVESYARFLLTFGPDSDKESRKIALLKTHEHGLDLAKIACRTVELVLSDLSEDLPDLNAFGPFDAHAKVDDRQLELIRSLEWLTFDPATYTEALQQANALARHFLSTDNPHAARELLFQLPPDLLAASAASSQTDDSSQIREFLDYNALFQCLDKHIKWSEIWSRQPRPAAPKVDHATFKDGVATLVDDFYSSTLTLLKSDWLKLSIQEDDHGIARRRAAELSRIRQLVVPHLILRLHHTLFDTKDILADSLTRCLDLANVVADERYQIYTEFILQTENKLPEYLLQVRQASVASLDKGMSAFGLVNSA